MDRDLLNLARQLAQSSGPGRPRQVFLRRAVSSVYYAMFHALAALCADQLVGSTRRASDPWSRTYRALEHKKGRDELGRRYVQRIDARVAEFAEVFVTLQELRHRADYDPRPQRLELRSVQLLISIAEVAISGLAGLPADHKLKLATTVLFGRSRV